MTRSRPGPGGLTGVTRPSGPALGWWLHRVRAPAAGALAVVMLLALGGCGAGHALHGSPGAQVPGGTGAPGPLTSAHRVA